MIFRFSFEFRRLIQDDGGFDGVEMLFPDRVRPSRVEGLQPIVREQFPEYPGPRFNVSLFQIPFMSVCARGGQVGKHIKDESQPTRTKNFEQGCTTAIHFPEL